MDFRTNDGEACAVIRRICESSARGDRQPAVQGNLDAHRSLRLRNHGELDSGDFAGIRQRTTWCRPAMAGFRRVGGTSPRQHTDRRSSTRGWQVRESGSRGLIQLRGKRRPCYTDDLQSAKRVIARLLQRDTAGPAKQIVPTFAHEFATIG